MGSVQTYTRTVTSETGRYAVWEPGDPVLLGDYGTSASGIYKKLGNIAEFGVSFNQESTGAGFWEYTSEGVLTASSDVAASVLGVAGGPEAALEITFAREKSLFVRAGESSWVQIANLREVAEALAKTKRWDFGWRLVTGVREAGSLLVVINRSRGSRVVVSGSVDALEQLKLGQLRLDGSVQISGDVEHKYAGMNSPFLVSLAKIRRFAIFGRVKHALGEGEIPEPYEELDPRAELDD